jgi:hypothetical protein
VYALPQGQWVQPVELQCGATVQTAIECSGLLQAIPELRLQELEVGIFHRRCGLDARLRAGDRVEIYRPLQLDPKEARRMRAARSQAQFARAASAKSR